MNIATSILQSKISQRQAMHPNSILSTPTPRYILQEPKQERLVHWALSIMSRPALSTESTCATTTRHVLSTLSHSQWVRGWWNDDTWCRRRVANARYPTARRKVCRADGLAAFLGKRAYRTDEARHCGLWCWWQRTTSSGNGAVGLSQRRWYTRALRFWRRLAEEGK
jgi:hypothetical protein